MPLRDSDCNGGRYRLACQELIDLECGPAAKAADPMAYAAAVNKWAIRLDYPIWQYRPLPVAWRFHESQKRIRLLTGGNRSSKSFALAMETIWCATGTHPWRKYDTPNEGWYNTTTSEKVGDTLWEPKLAKMLAGWNHEVVWHNKQRNIPEMVFVQPGDKIARKFWSKITFKSYEQGRESFQAAGVRYIHNDEQLPRDIWVEQNSRISAESPLSIACAFTPIDSQPWLEEQMLSPPPDWDLFEMPLDDNRISAGGFIPDEAIDALISLWPPEVRETRRRGKWGSFLGSVFTTFSRDIHVVKEQDEPEFFRDGRVPGEIVGGIDWGGSNPFCNLFATRIPHYDNDWYVFDEYYYDNQLRGGRLLSKHAEEIHAMEKRWGKAASRTWADHGPTEFLEIAQYGVHCQPADKDDVLATIRRVQSFLQPRAHLPSDRWPQGRPRLHIAERCENLVRQMQGYHWKPRSKSADAKDEPVKVDDHAVDPCRYIIFSEPEDGTPLRILDPLGNQFAYNPIL